MVVLPSTSPTSSSPSVASQVRSLLRLEYFALVVLSTVAELQD
jgi:hypothetical protein